MLRLMPWSWSTRNLTERIDKTSGILKTPEIIWYSDDPLCFEQGFRPSSAPVSIYSDLSARRRSQQTPLILSTLTGGLYLIIIGLQEPTRVNWRDVPVPYYRSNQGLIHGHVEPMYLWKLLSENRQEETACGVSKLIETSIKRAVAIFPMPIVTSRRKGILPAWRGCLYLSNPGTQHQFFEFWRVER